MKHFTIPELTHSFVALNHGISNIPSPAAVSNLHLLVNNVLDPLRVAYGAPIMINSGYRSVILNRAVGGAPKSQHTKGEAADITAGNPTENLRLFQLIISLGLPFDQLIDEKNYSWLHVSYTVQRPLRRQVLHLR